MTTDLAVRADKAWAGDPPVARNAGAVVAGAAGAAALAIATLWLTRPAPRPPARRHAGDVAALRLSAGTLSAAVLLDSAVEHYRGSFENPGMLTPLIIATLGIAADSGGRATPRVVAGTVHASAVIAGSAGVAFHTYNVLRKPGGLSWLNLFYAAPVGAPAALALGGLIGIAARQIETAGENPRLLGMPAGRALAGLTAIGLAGTVGEAGLMHFRGSFQNPAMFLPVSLPPVAAALMAIVALEPPGRGHRATRNWLRLTAALGVIGVGFHAHGVSRAMGGWYNWSQNLIDGPPLPAPPSFTALAVAGLAALRLREREDG